MLILAALWMQHQARAAEAHHDLEAIRQSVSEFLSHKLGADPAARIVVNPLDQRLRVAACPQPLKPWLPSSSKLLGPTTVGVRCLGESPWTLYVSARIERYTDIQIAARPLARGDIVGAGDLRTESRDVSGLRAGFFEEAAELIGKVVRRPISAGNPVRPTQVEDSYLIKRGQKVVILARVGGLSVRMRGKALANGAAGDHIRIENSRSDRIVEGVVNDAGIVEVSL
ncbi:MAG: flagellar basal body P-ring formation protein FlgA [Chromatiales bacterium]|nr:flagellar basal body P-ring formation protein FlgA [Chromatiales bacterium]